MTEAESLFNDQLQQSAMLASALLSRDMDPADRQIVEAATVDDTITPDHSIVYQVFTDSGELLLGFNTTASEPLVRLEEGYSDANFGGYRWHALVYREPQTNRWIIAAQRDDIRYALAERVVLESILPIVLGIPVAGLLIWVLISLGMRPITRLANELESKEISDLSALKLEELPLELKPLQDSTNELLQRLRASFDREKRFAADAAHELRTPISVLKVQMHNLLAEMESPSSSVSQLQVGIDRMGHLIEQILDLNRTAPDLYAAQFELTDLYETCQEVIRDLYELFNEKNQQVELLGASCQILGDRFALMTLLKNLLGNASKYTQAGGRISVRVEQSGEEVTLEVEDDGPGIPATERERVMERFYRIGGDRHATGEPGCGLGLAIVKHIVDLHKASIELSEPMGHSGLLVRIGFRAANQVI